MGLNNVSKNIQRATGDRGAAGWVGPTLVRNMYVYTLHTQIVQPFSAAAGRRTCVFRAEQTLPPPTLTPVVGTQRPLAAIDFPRAAAEIMYPVAARRYFVYDTRDVVTNAR